MWFWSMSHSFVSIAIMQGSWDDFINIVPSYYVCSHPSLIPHSDSISFHSCSLSLLYAVHLSKTCSTLSSCSLHITRLFVLPSSHLCPQTSWSGSESKLEPGPPPISRVIYILLSFNCFFTAVYRSRVFLFCTSSIHLCSHFLLLAFTDILYCEGSQVKHLYKAPVYMHICVSTAVER